MFNNGLNRCEIGLSSLNSSHSVTGMQQSASFRHWIAGEVYLILFLRIVLALGMAAGWLY